MSQAARNDAAASPDELPERLRNGPQGLCDQALQTELERRISALASVEADIGSLGARDWAATILLFVLLPVLLVWGFR